MRYRALAIAPVVMAAAALISSLLTPASGRPTVLAASVEAAKVLAILGCATAARAFEPDDYMRRAWTWLGAGTLFLFARDVAALAAWPAALQGGLAVAGNGAGVAGTWILARAWTVAGLDAAGPPRGGRALQWGAAALALAVTGWPLVGDARSLAGGDALALVPLASDVADTIVLALLAPLLATTLALRGGTLRWPWALLTVSNLLWLVFDATYGVVALLHVDPQRGRVATEALRVLATTYTFSAGVAQRWAVLSSAPLGARAEPQS